MTSPALPAPVPLPDFDPAVIVDLDVRDDLRAGREPFARILDAAKSLPTGFVLHLRTPFRPTPLFAVLNSAGFEFHTEGFADDDWSSWFWRDTVAPRLPAGQEAVPLPSSGAWDLRHLPPPEPLRLLLERLAVAREVFDVLLPAYSELLAGLLANQGWEVEVVAMSPEGARIRLSPMKQGR